MYAKYLYCLLALQQKISSALNVHLNVKIINNMSGEYSTSFHSC
jgi:hypothetical protein